MGPQISQTHELTNFEISSKFKKITSQILEFFFFY